MCKRNCDIPCHTFLSDLKCLQCYSVKDKNKFMSHVEWKIFWNI
jgi:hypothetical protein